MRVRLRSGLLRAPRRAPGERRAREVEHPVVRGERARGCAGAGREERAEHDVRGGEREQWEDLQRALARARVRERGPALPRAEDGALVPVGGGDSSG